LDDLGLNPGRDKKLFLWLTQSHIQRAPSFFPRDKAAGREFDHSPPSSAEAKNEWSYAATPPIFLQGVDKDNVTYLNATYDDFTDSPQQGCN
jgi:hypothetical protein